jgi:formyltetrahydrofolate synthetase
MIRFVYEMIDELEEKIKMIIEAILNAWLIAVFRERQKMMDKYIKENETILSKFSFYVFSSRISLIEIENLET